MRAGQWVAGGAAEPIGQIVRELEGLLGQASVPNPRFEAELIVGDALGTGRAGVYGRWNDPLPPDTAGRIESWAKRRAAREPIQYLRGVQEFLSRPYRVTPDVLIPRPETECLVGCALDVMERNEDCHRVVDVGTGSGCIAVSLALSRPRATVWATDLSAEALGIARSNAMRHGAAVQFVHCDLLGPFRAPLLDLVVSNPPYLAEADRAGLQREVVEHEPAMALFGGADGLEVIRRLVRQASDRLRPGGWLLMEIAWDQTAAVRELAEAAGLEVVDIVQDLARLDRVVRARKH